MAFLYRRSKLGFDLTYRSKITTPKPPIKNPVPIINHNIHSSKFTFISNYQPVRVTKVSSLSSLNIHRNSHFRCYHVMRKFKRSKRPIVSSLIVLIGLGIWVTIWTGNVETVWYAIFKRLFLMSVYVERVIGESQFQMMKAEFEWKVLPESHPDRVRVDNILNHVVIVITVLNNGLKRGKRKWLKLAVSYMERMNWEVLVVEDDAAYACCLPGGKIVVFTGLFKHLTTDDEIATVICHEVAHVVVRHVRKRLEKNLWRAFGRQVYYMVARPNLDPREVFFMLDLPFSPRMETEADDMGLLLLAYAGYDTQEAPKVFEKMGQVSAFHDYLTIHPRGKLTSKMLSEVGKAISVNEEAIAQREVDT